VRHSFSTNDRVKKPCARRKTLLIAGFALQQNKFDGFYVARREGCDLIERLRPRRSGIGLSP
jgi:hypothetical protein